jgi:hypothetical protein
MGGDGARAINVFPRRVCLSGLQLVCACLPKRRDGTWNQRRPSQVLRLGAVLLSWLDCLTCVLALLVLLGPGGFDWLPCNRN